MTRAADVSLAAGQLARATSVAARSPLGHPRIVRLREPLAHRARFDPVGVGDLGDRVLSGVERPDVLIGYLRQERGRSPRLRRLRTALLERPDRLRLERVSHGGASKAQPVRKSPANHDLVEAAGIEPAKHAPRKPAATSGHLLGAALRGAVQRQAGLEPKHPEATPLQHDNRRCAAVIRDAPGAHLPDPSETRPAPKGRERGRIVVTADLDTSEPLAERLRRCDGDTGPQRALLPSKGGVRLRSGSPVPQG